MDAAERQRRYRARKKGFDVPKLKPGPKPGYKQSADHIEKRKRWGDEHHAWTGDVTDEKNGRKRARARIDTDQCSSCGEVGPRIDVHHIDGNTSNNDLGNLVALCRRCHMREDGRLDAFRELAKRNQPKAVASRWR